MLLQGQCRMNIRSMPMGEYAASEPDQNGQWSDMNNAAWGTVSAV